MIDRFIDLLISTVKDKAWWPLAQPIVTLLSLYVMAGVIAYQYIEWRYNFTPELTTFLRSYLFKQITVVFLTVALLALVLGARWQQGVKTEAVARVQRWVRSGVWHLVIIGLLLVFSSAVLLRLVPHRVSHITVKFLEQPESFDQYALAYIIYELNRFQSDWHFTLDPDVYNPDSRSSTEAQTCGADMLCNARLVAHDEPLIGITEKGFSEDSFWVNSGVVSVVSAGQWQAFRPPSTYEYLSYSLVVQSTLIHLNQSCGGAPEGAFRRSRLSYGDLFEFVPRRNEMKAAILAAHLSPKGQELLANCFGLEYMHICNELLSLDWLHSGRVHDNLEKTFSVKL